MPTLPPLSQSFLFFFHFRNHVVSLTSSTYGALKLDKEEEKKEEEEEEEEEKEEVINAWELMGDLEEESIRGPKTKTVIELGIGRSPFKRLNKSASPKKANKLTLGKENSNSNYQRVSSSRRKSLSPLFDPELVEAYEKELCQEQEQEQEQEEQIKKIISVNSSGRFDCSVADFKSKCPPKGEDSVVVYTTTLRGIRKTFEECNTVRSILESHQIRMYERDVSMDYGFKEELRKLMGVDEFRIPLVFVKARLIGGADEISKLEEEGKLGSLLHRIPRNSSSVCVVGLGLSCVWIAVGVVRCWMRNTRTRLDVESAMRMVSYTALFVVDFFLLFFLSKSVIICWVFLTIDFMVSPPVQRFLHAESTARRQSTSLPSCHSDPLRALIFDLLSTIVTNSFNELG